MKTWRLTIDGEGESPERMIPGFLSVLTSGGTRQIHGSARLEIDELFDAPSLGSTPEPESPEPEAPRGERPIWTDPSGKPDLEMDADYAYRHGVTMPSFYTLRGTKYVLNDMDAAEAELKRLGF